MLQNFYNTAFFRKNGAPKFVRVYYDKRFTIDQYTAIFTKTGGGCWGANWTEAGLRYVANGRTKTAAYSQWRRHIRPLSAMYSA